ncbi:Protein ODORANT1, partial [Cucurbita argyrosperma subsp. sororia]
MLQDNKLVTFITYGHCCWRALPKLTDLLRRCGKSCRLRWTNYLCPDLKHGLFDEAEEQCSPWQQMVKDCSDLTGRTDNEIKNHWNKKLIKMGIDPVTTKPLQKQETESCSQGSCTDSSAAISPLTEANYCTEKDEPLTSQHTCMEALKDDSNMGQQNLR